MKILKHEFHASLKISASNSSLYQNILQVGRTFLKLCRTVVPLVLIVPTANVVQLYIDTINFWIQNDLHVKSMASYAASLMGSLI